MRNHEVLIVESRIHSYGTIRAAVYGIAAMICFLAPAFADTGTNEIYRIFNVDISGMPVAKRYAVLTKLSQRLWEYLGTPPTNDAEVVLYSTARLQSLVERELATVKIPEGTVDRGPLQHGVDGTPYYVMSKDQSRNASAENRMISDVQGYLRQLRHFSEHYPNRIDSDYMRDIFQSLDPERQNSVKQHIRLILRRSPRWK